MKNITTILKKCLRGNEKAHKSLFEHHKQQWFLTSLRYSKSRHEAEDIMQEGLVQIYKDLHQFDSNKSAFQTWSNRVLVHAALKYIKKSNWQNSFTSIDDYGEGEVTSSVLEDLYEEEIIKLIQKLPLGYKLVFNLFVVEGYSHKEIAKKLEISPGTSKSQLFKARNMLRKRLEESLGKTQSRYE